MNKIRAVFTECPNCEREQAGFVDSDGTFVCGECSPHERYVEIDLQFFHQQEEAKAQREWDELRAPHIKKQRAKRPVANPSANANGCLLFLAIAIVVVCIGMIHDKYWPAPEPTPPAKNRHYTNEELDMYEDDYYSEKEGDQYDGIRGR